MTMKGAGRAWQWCAKALSLKLMVTGLIVFSVSLMLVMPHFKVSIYRKGCDSIELGVVPPIDFVPAIDFVPNHVIYPPSVFTSSLAEPIALEDLLHQAMLHEACLKHTESMILWTYARNNDTSSRNLINRDDPNVIDKIRQCPDIDIYHPAGIRGAGYCEDSVAYLKYLESRLLPAWVLEGTFEDPLTKHQYRYHELCPRTPVIMFNHYWFDGRAAWPEGKKLYVMPNIEMGQLQSGEYWSVDAVLCKTAICARRITKWYKQQGNPRNARVFYTRHSSSDIATLAKWRSGESVVKNYSTVSFAHASGGSPFKGTSQIFECWTSRPDFPPLKIVIDRGRYNDAYKNDYEKRVNDSNGQIRVHVDGMDGQQYGTMLADVTFFLCPSTMEGYGHYLNQVRAAGAVIVTTDLAPMNEFLSPASAVLIPVKRKTHEHMILSGGFQGEHGLKEDEGGLIAEFSGADVCDAVERAMNLTVAEREAMGALARQQYHIDTRFFAAKMRELRTFAVVESGRTDDY